MPRKGYTTGVYLKSGFLRSYQDSRVYLVIIQPLDLFKPRFLDQF
jgi:hypothetical protein